jgi:hypothetical protein
VLISLETVLWVFVSDAGPHLDSAINSIECEFTQLVFLIHIQDDQKVSVQPMITKQKVTSKVMPHYVAQSDCLPADRQGQGDTRLTLTPSVIPNFNCVIMVSD